MMGWAEKPFPKKKKILWGVYNLVSTLSASIYCVFPKALLGLSLAHRFQSLQSKILTMEYFTMRFLIEEIQNTINEGNNTNIVISPTSMNIILNMAASGSHGKTLEQFLGFLGSKSVAELNSKTSSLMALIDVKDNNRPVVSMENVMLIQQGFTLKRSFQKLVWDFYKTEPISVDFDQVGSLILLL